MTDVDLDALVGHRFEGGERTVEHWENWLLTDCTQRAPMTDDLLHPVALFHVPIQAAATSIADIFAVAGGGAAGSVTLLGYDWEYLAPMYEGMSLRGVGGITAAQRHRDDAGHVAHDDVSFSIELVAPGGEVVARVTNRWRFLR